MKELLELYLIFAKIGSVNFGGGYAMLPLLERELVTDRGWVTTDELWKGSWSQTGAGSRPMS